VPVDPERRRGLLIVRGNSDELSRSTAVSRRLRFVSTVPQHRVAPGVATKLLPPANTTILVHLTATPAARLSLPSEVRLRLHAVQAPLKYYPPAMAKGFAGLGLRCIISQASVLSTAACGSLNGNALQRPRSPECNEAVNKCLATCADAPSPDKNETTAMGMRSRPDSASEASCSTRC
jgi:hypothetical protein